MGDFEITFLMNAQVTQAIGIWILASIIRYAISFIP